MSATGPSSPPKRPRLSLQIKALANGPSVRTSRSLAAAVDVKSPTAFNTLSNVYATAVDRSTPVQENAPTTAFLGTKPVLRLQTQDGGPGSEQRRLHTPYLGPYLDTPLTAQPMSPATSKDSICFPSAMTATPPLSAVPPEQSQGNTQNTARVFTFESRSTTLAKDEATRTPTSQAPRRRTTAPAGAHQLPYTHPRSLRSILRNSPLPPLSTKSPESPRRQSLRLQEKAARRVGYNSPLTQTITTSLYTRSHIDLLAEDVTPTTPSTTSDEDVLDQTMAYMASNETRDGGQTPGPFEEMRRRMAGLHASTPVALTPSGGGIRKRGGKKREKKRRWVWTIGQDSDGEEGGSPVPGSMPPRPTTASETAVAKQQSLAASVPVIAVPLPRPRTRMQTAKAAGVAAAVAAVTSAAANPTLIAAPIIALTQIPPPTHSREKEEVILHQQQECSAPAPALPQLPALSLAVPDAARLRGSETTPEPETAIMIMNVEPPTPSVDSTASMSQDSVFERASSSSEMGDVEMSDASSVYSVEAAAGEDSSYTFKPATALFLSSSLAVSGGGQVQKAGGMLDTHMMDMDTDSSDTPTTAIKTAFAVEKGAWQWGRIIEDSNTNGAGNGARP